MNDPWTAMPKSLVTGLKLMIVCLICIGLIASAVLFFPTEHRGELDDIEQEHGNH